MSAFSAGCFSFDFADWLLGFSFTPNVAGPNGSGSPGSASSVSLVSIVVGCPTLPAAQEANTCYIYSVELEDPSDIGSSGNLVGQSTSMSTGHALGSTSYSTTYSFSGISLDPTKQYFAYFSADKNTFVDSSSPYTGGTAYDVFLEDDDASPQFQVNMST
ncbi:MAG TPA: hypothetical protein VM008_17435 [Phycisphaerae bacterium]|nr:hypothetical protein [Phycisphaerae bacterium]